MKNYELYMQYLPQILKSDKTYISGKAITGFALLNFGDYELALKKASTLKSEINSWEILKNQKCSCCGQIVKDINIIPLFIKTYNKNQNLKLYAMISQTKYLQMYPFIDKIKMLTNKFELNSFYYVNKKTIICVSQASNIILEKSVSNSAFKKMLGVNKEIDYSFCVGKDALFR